MIPDNPDILVAYKKSRYDQFVVDEADNGIEQLIEQGDISVSNLLEAHRKHEASLEKVCETLESRQLSFEAAPRGAVDNPEDYDLVVPVGGDGTVLDISHRVEDVPVLAINSDPESSVGYFCAGTATEFSDLLEDVLGDESSPFQLQRFRVAINDEALPWPVLNDVLISHSNPAGVARYVLQVGDHTPEEQRSSGIWIATPAGSTAAIRSAGGLVLPLDSKCLEYLVREPYPLPDTPYRYTKGIQPIERSFQITSKMNAGRVFLDGPHLSESLSIGDVVSIGADAHPLIIYGLDESRRV